MRKRIYYWHYNTSIAEKTWRTRKEKQLSKNFISSLPASSPPPLCMRATWFCSGVLESSLNGPSTNHMRRHRRRLIHCDWTLSKWSVRGQGRMLELMSAKALSLLKACTYSSAECGHLYPRSLRSHQSQRSRKCHEQGGSLCRWRRILAFGPSRWVPDLYDGTWRRNFGYDDVRRNHMKREICLTLPAFLRRTYRVHKISTK